MAVVPNKAPTVYVNWALAQTPAITPVTSLAIYSDGTFVVFSTNSGSGTGSTYFSTNGGRTYTQTTTGSGPGTNPVNGVVVYYNAANSFYAVSPGVGLYRYTVPTTTWSAQLISTVSNTDQFTSVATSADGLSIFVTSSTASSGAGTITYSTPVSAGWVNNPRLVDTSTVINATNITSICCDSTGTFVFFVSTGGGVATLGAGIYSSASTGASNYWTRTVASTVFSKISCSANGNVVLAVGTGGIYLSTNGNAKTGSGGTAVSTATFASVFSGTPSGTVSSCSVSQDGTKLYFTTSGSGGAIYYSSDLGTTWRIIPFMPNTITGAYNLALRPDGYPIALVDNSYNVDYGTTTVLCFKEGSKILCFVDGKEEYLPVETLKPGSFVKTYAHGYKAIESIGSSKIYNPAHTLRGKNRLYVCKKANYPELTEDLVITGCHSILVDSIDKKQEDEIKELAGDIYVTDKKYRLMACLDDRAEPYTEEGVHNIWHFALANKDYYMNYGVYANGLLVETTSRRMMKELSGMELV